MVERYYFDTSSILDLDAYGLIKYLRKVKAIIVPEILNEIRNRNLKRRLKKIAPYTPQKRPAFIQGLDTLDYGERGIVRTMLCEHNRQLCIYVSNDAYAQSFINKHKEHYGYIRVCN